MKPLIITPIKTDIFKKGDDLVEFIMKNTPSAFWQEEVVLTITSKIVSLAENRLVSKSEISKKELIQRESDYYLGEIGYGTQLTITHGLLIASAGIDESNSEDEHYIIYPEDPYKSATELRKALVKKTGLKNLGILLTDSRTSPLRMGVVGVALAYAGIEPIENKIGEKDLFGRPLAMTQVNLVDSLAASAVLTMGEAAEQCPLAMIQNAKVQFTENPNRAALDVSPERDMYRNLYAHLMT